MEQLFPQDMGRVGKAAPFKSGFGSFIFHSVLVLFILSLRYVPETLPARLTRVMLVAPLPPAPPPPPPPVIKASAVHVVRAARVFSPVLMAPVEVPQHAAVGIVDAPEIESAGVVGGIPGGVPGGIPGGVIGGILPAVPAPSPVVHEVKLAKPPEPVVPIRIQVSSDVQEAKLLVMIKPDYPPMAKQARIQGSVHLTAVIDRDGCITELKVLGGNPLLVGAAREAVEKWRYSPTILNGQAVEVATEIFVKFRLAS